jgi:choline dehydrogenase-like flavoprotein
MPAASIHTAPVADFIIVGSGSAGAVLADRLSADGRHTVLLIEEGGGDNWLSRMPKGFGKLIGDPLRAHFYQTTPKPGANVDPQIWLRGKMLGGSSAINGMVWNRGVAADYDRLEALGNPGWGWKEMLPCLRALEDHQMGASDYRGTGGPIAVITNPNRNGLADAFIAAGNSLQLSTKEDQNGPDLEGIGYAQWNIDQSGKRISSARVLLDKARDRANLTIQTGTRIHRVLIESGKAVGVTGVANGHDVNLYAGREVILAAGALVSPKILQHSGIGDGALLQSLGIDTLHHSPNVGRRMREHQVLALNFRLRDWKFSDNREYGGARLIGNMLNYMVRGKGPMARGAAEAIAFVKAHPKSTRADTQIMFNPYSLGDTSKGVAFEQEPGMQCYSYILRPQSEGHALITSADPSAPLDINPGFFDADIDRETAIEGTRAIRRIMEQDALKPHVVGETEKTSWAQSDDDIMHLYKTLGSCGLHAVGTAAMGPDATDVLDNHCRVRGVASLRVIDCSIFREMPAGNTNAPVMAAAWRLSEIMQAEARG